MVKNNKTYNLKKNKNKTRSLRLSNSTTLSAFQQSLPAIPFFALQFLPSPASPAPNALALPRNVTGHGRHLIALVRQRRLCFWPSENAAPMEYGWGKPHHSSHTRCNLANGDPQPAPDSRHGHANIIVAAAN